MELTAQELEKKRLKTLKRIERASRNGIEYVVVRENSLSREELLKSKWFGTFPIVPRSQAVAFGMKIVEL